MLGAKGKAAREQLVWAAAGSLFSSFIAQPFEACKILAQVQHLPRRPPTVRSDSQPGPPPTGEDEQEQEDDEGEGAGERDLDDEDEVRTFFEDAVERSRAPKVPLEAPIKPTVNADGYVLRTGADGVEREWILRRGRGEGNGPWSLTKRMWNGEGPSAPWKGALHSSVPWCAESTLTQVVRTGFWTAVTFDALQHYLPALLNPLLLPLFQSVSSPSLPLSISLSLSPARTLVSLIASHSLAGFLLSPLDLVRTRLIVQSSRRAHRTYPSNPLTALRMVVRAEGGWWNTYLHPALF